MYLLHLSNLRRCAGSIAIFMTAVLLEMTMAIKRKVGRNMEEAGQNTCFAGVELSFVAQF